MLLLCLDRYAFEPSLAVFLNNYPLTKLCPLGLMHSKFTQTFYRNKAMTQLKLLYNCTLQKPVKASPADLGIRKESCVSKMKEQAYCSSQYFHNEFPSFQYLSPNLPRLLSSKIEVSIDFLRSCNIGNELNFLNTAIYNHHFKKVENADLDNIMGKKMWENDWNRSLVLVKYEVSCLSSFVRGTASTRLPYQTALIRFCRCYWLQNRWAVCFLPGSIYNANISR